jgi:PLP dependent protein
MDIGDIRKNVKDVLGGLPEGVELVAAAKTRTPMEVVAAVEAGVSIIGENYVQEAQAARKVLGESVKWHFIGHLQKNKVKKAVSIFDLIETVDSVELAEEIDKRSRAAGKIMPVLIEINSARESQKFGVLPEDTPGLIKRISEFENIKVMGLMTMGPFSGDPGEARPYFSETKKIFEHMKLLQSGRYEMRYLSMGMTNSYKVAIEEGANMVRLGTKIFGERE